MKTYNETKQMPETVTVTLTREQYVTLQLTLGTYRSRGGLDATGREMVEAAQKVLDAACPGLWA